MAPELKIIERIEALFRQAEGTNNEEESRTFTAKAQELLTKYSLSEFQLDALGKVKNNDHVESVAILVNDPQMDRKYQLLSVIAKANGLNVVNGNKGHSYNGKSHDGMEAPHGFGIVRTISSDKFSKNYKFVYLTGFSKDIEATTLIYTSLLIQAKAEIKRASVPSWENKSTWVSHFFLGFIGAIQGRLQTGRNESQASVIADAKESGVDLLPVLVERKEQVQAAYEQQWSGTRLIHSRGSYTRSSTSGYDVGRTAGGRSDVGHKGIGGIGALGRG